MRHPLPLVALAAFSLAAKPAAPSLDADTTAKVRDGKLVLTKTSDETGRSIVTGVVELRTTPEKIWSIVLSNDHIKASSSTIKELRTTRDVQNGDVREIDLDYTLKVGWSEIKYSVNRKFRSGDGYLTWTMDKSRPADIAWTEGSYSVFPGSAAGRVLFVYRGRIETGRSIPAWLEEDLTESTLKKYLVYIQKISEQ